MQSKIGRIRKLLFMAPGIVAVVIGLIGSSLGSAWSPQVYEFLFAFEFLLKNQMQTVISAKMGRRLPQNLKESPS